jgi:hypothetical protein
MAKKSKPAAGKTPGKTPFHTVVEKIQRGTISDTEFSNYFAAQPNPRQPFDFTIGINRAAVDLQGVEKSGKFADALVHDASIGRDQRIRAAAPPKGFQRKTPIVAEGDSWFRLPHLIMPPTLVDVLQETYGYPIDNMAHWGDTLADMIPGGSVLASARHRAGGHVSVLSRWQRRTWRCRRDRAISEPLRRGPHPSVRCCVLHQAGILR